MVLKNTGHVYYRLSLSRGLSDVFLTTSLGSSVFWRSAEVKRHFITLAGVYTAHIIYHCFY